MRSSASSAVTSPTPPLVAFVDDDDSHQIEVASQVWTCLKSFPMHVNDCISCRWNEHSRRIAISSQAREADPESFWNFELQGEFGCRSSPDLAVGSSATPRPAVGGDSDSAGAKVSESECVVLLLCTMLWYISMILLSACSRCVHI